MASHTQSFSWLFYTSCLQAGLPWMAISWSGLLPLPARAAPLPTAEAHELQPFKSE